MKLIKNVDSTNKSDILKTKTIYFRVV